MIVTSIVSNDVNAMTLPDVLQFALRQDPRLLEAKAEQDAASQNRKSSESMHYPTVSLVSSRVLTQYHQYESDYRRKTDIGVQSKLNLYAWGGIESSITRDKEKERFAYYKFFETREELGSTIANLYLKAIYFKESLFIAQANLRRHQLFLDHLRVVAKYDRGRQSEFAQVESRYLNAESTILDLERHLQTTLSRLNLYTPRKLQEKDLKDPFSKQTAEDFFRKYDKSNRDMHPSLLAQQAEVNSAKADIEVADAATKPQLNLEGTATRHNREIAVTFSWDLFNRPAHYNTQHANAKFYSVTARKDQLERDINERYETAKIEMVNSQKRAATSKRHASVQTDVAKNYAEQFKVSRRSLLEVLDAYADLSRIEHAYVDARHEFRTATIAYLLAQAKIASWAGFAENL
ncbi:TolC family protein [Pelistega sp. MC2]|uniref:TolC family protein n=1 Tax=Pelistega sp. MC2 TaxID=1720297 RepID=UPI000AE101CF|nr:TolC family protein [Pelistega sp. MC2]